MSLFLFALFGFASALGGQGGPNRSLLPLVIPVFGAQETRILVEEDFEGSQGGTPADRLNGWRIDDGASGVVRDVAGSGRALGFHSGNIIKTLDAESPDDVSWVNMRIKVQPMDEEPTLRSDTGAAFYFTRSGQLRVNDGGVWKDAESGRVRLEDWQQIVAKLDYGSSPQTWSIWLNGKPAGTDLRFANRVEKFGKITFGNESTADSFLDRLEIGVGEPEIGPVAEAVELVEAKEPEPEPEVTPEPEPQFAPEPETEVASEPEDGFPSSLTELLASEPESDVTPSAPGNEPEAATPEKVSASRMEGERRVPDGTDPGGSIRRSEREEAPPPRASGGEMENVGRTVPKDDGPTEAHPVLPPVTIFLIPVAALVGLFLQKRRAGPRSGGEFQIVPLSALALFAVILFVVFPPVGAAPGRSILFLAAGLALYAAGLAFWLMREDRPGEIFVLFRIAPFVGAFGLLLIGFGSIVRTEIGISLLSVGAVLGAAGCWTFAESGFRGSRSFYAGVLAALAGPVVIFQQLNLGGWILLLSFCLFPLLGAVKEAGRIVTREDKRKKKVVAGRGGKEKVRQPKRPRRTRPAAAERPVVLSRDSASSAADSEGNEEQEETPFFGEGVLATEPGRQGNVRIDPWTGAAVKEGDEEPPPGTESEGDFPEQTDSFDPDAQEDFSRIEPLDDEGDVFTDDDLLEQEENEKEDTGDEKRS